MYEYIKGTLVHSHTSYTIIDVQGVGYHLITHPNLMSQLPPINKTAQLYTAHIVREDSHSLYGFSSIQERDLFKVFLGISGVGPKTALALTGHLPYEQLLQAVSDNDITTICKVPGIGKKTAERLLLDVRDKLPRMFKANKETLISSVLIKDAHVEPTMVRDAVHALVNLGYTQVVAEKGVSKVLSKNKDGKDLDLTALITHALKQV